MFTLENFRIDTSHIVAAKFTRLLRRFRLDEIPQLIHIISGRMSFVGPRPLPVSYTASSTNSNFISRYSVSPGIFGLAQANGGEYLDFKSRLRYDIFYVKNQAFLLDLRIIFICLFNTFLSKQPKSTSLPKFNV